MELSRAELITLGQSVPTELLTEWADAQVGVARRSLDRLSRRGATAEFLAGIEQLTDAVRSLEGQQERGKKAAPDATGRVEEVLASALDWWREVKLAAKVEFAADPNALARFRTGVRVGRSAPRLGAEIEFLLPLLAKHRAQLAWLGIGDEFLRRGEALLGQLRQTDAQQEAIRTALPPATAELNERKGELYDFTRKLVRIARLEFRNEPERAAAFSYDILRRHQTALKGARTRKARTGKTA